MKLYEIKYLWLGKFMQAGDLKFYIALRDDDVNLFALEEEMRARTSVYLKPITANDDPVTAYPYASVDVGDNRYSILSSHPKAEADSILLKATWS